MCLVGQDPYHTPGVANGLAFSISAGNKLQPSLVNIFKELKRDVGVEIPKSGDLTKWAERGVLLLNTSLTVYEHQANSHAGWGWDNFTKAVLQAAHGLSQPVVFLLWGANAISLMRDLVTSPLVCVDDNYIFIENFTKKAFVLSSHPSPLSYSKQCKGSPPFKGSRPFSNANDLLVQMGSKPIDWNLV